MIMLVASYNYDIACVIYLQEFAKVAQAVDPEDFHCTETSPTAAAVWSDTEPPVALTHIFCGQIKHETNKNGVIIDEAEGFHSRPNNVNPVCARVAEESKVTKNTYPLECYKKIEVRQTEDKWIARKSGMDYCFFPSQWSIADTVNELTDIYKYCMNKKKKTDEKGQICYKRSMKHNNYYSIVIFFYKRNGQNVINSAFPIPKGGKLPSYCNKNICT